MDTIAEDKIKPLNITVSLPRDIPAGTIVLRGATALTMRGDEIINNAAR